jgi:hypothetical protein
MTRQKSPEARPKEWRFLVADTSVAHSRTVPDLRRIEVPVEEELLAAVEAALVWFEDRARHQDPDHAFGGEGRVEQKLRRAIAEVWIREEL